MALEKRNPLPIGRYWIDILNSKVEEFSGFLEGHKSTIHVEVTEGDSSEEGGTTFYLFNTSAPFTWLPVNFGYPTIAGPEIKSKADTTQRPDLPKNPLDNLADNLDKIEGFAKLGLGILALAFIANAIKSHKG